MKKTEHRILSQAPEVRATEGEPTRCIGYAAVFHDGTPGTEYQLRDNAVERVMPGCFDHIISDKADVLGMFNHDPNMVMGRTSSGTMALSVDGTGLRYEITMPDTTMGHDLMEMMKRGDVRGSSFSFYIPEGGEKWVRNGDGWIRELHRVDVVDVGPVALPAYSGTSAGVRTADDATDALESLKQEENRLMELQQKLDEYKQRAAQVAGEAKDTAQRAMTGADVIACCNDCVASCQACTDTCRACVDACTAMKGQPDDATIEACKECIRFCRTCVQNCYACLDSCYSMIGGDYARDGRAEVEAERRAASR